MLNSKTNICFILIVCLFAIKAVYLREYPGKILKRAFNLTKNNPFFKN